MLNKLIVFLTVSIITPSLSFAIAPSNPTTYNFSSPTYVAASGAYNTSMRVTGSITTNNPYPANTDFIFDGDFGINITAFSFSDGVQTISNTNGGVIENFNHAFYVGTDASGQINHMQLIVNGKVAAAQGETENMIGFAMPNDPANYKFTTFGFGVQGVTCATYVAGFGCSDSYPNVNNLGLSNVDHFTNAFANSISYVPDSGSGSGSVGFVSFEAQGGQIISNFSVAAADGTKPAGMYSPQGKIAYTVTTAAPGGTATTQIGFSSPLPAGFSLYKVDNAGVYTQIPQQAGADAWVKVDANTIAITLTDGGTFDLDGVVNSSVTDPIVVMAAVAATSIPTLSIWGLLLLTALIGFFGINYNNRKKI